MSLPERTSQDSIFAVVPEATDAPHTLIDPQYVASAPLSDLLDATYFELHSDKLRFDTETLKIWELRISLLLFTGQLPAAKREAIALNNALYRAENPGPSGSGPHGHTSAPSTAVSPNRPNLSSAPSAITVLPLPNNNSGHVPDSLLMLLLSLKCAPGLARAHELYRLCYQKRLRGESKNDTKKEQDEKEEISEKSDMHVNSSDAKNITESPEFCASPEPVVRSTLQGQLAAQAYAVAAALLVSRNFGTLQAFLTSLRSDIQREISRNKTQSNTLNSEEKNYANLEVSRLQAYYSNVTLLFLLAKVHARRAAGADQWGTLYEADLAYVSKHTWDPLRFVTGKIAPQIGGPLSPLDESHDREVSVEKLAELVANDHISIRTICCLLAVWSLAATHENAHLSAAEFSIAPSDSEKNGTKLDHVYGIISRKWSEHFNKLYGLE